MNTTIVRHVATAFLASCASFAIAAPVVVQPGSAAGYLYFSESALSSLSSGSDGSGGSGGSGGGSGSSNLSDGYVEIIKATDVSTYTNYTVSIGSESCDASCTNKIFTTGSGPKSIAANRIFYVTDMSNNVICPPSSNPCPINVPKDTTVTYYVRPGCSYDEIGTAVGNDTCPTQGMGFGANIVANAPGSAAKYVGQLPSDGRHILVLDTNSGQRHPWGYAGVDVSGCTNTSGYVIDDLACSQYLQSNPDNTGASGLCQGTWRLPTAAEMDFITSKKSSSEIQSLSIYDGEYWVANEIDANTAYTCDTFGSYSCTWYQYDKSSGMSYVICVQSK